MRTGIERMRAEATTRDRLRELVAEHPEWTMADLARALGISRERVRQIATAESIAVRSGYRGLGERAASMVASKVQTGGVAVPVSQTVIGTVGELMAAADLTARGLVVFFPLVRTAACDLITLARDGTVERIEVRCGHRSGKRLRFSKKTTGRADRYAVIVSGEPVAYEPPLDAYRRQ